MERAPAVADWFSSGVIMGRLLKYFLPVAERSGTARATDILIFHRIPSSGLNNAKSTAEVLKVTGRVTGDCDLTVAALL